jgi:hypothetical protein
VYRSENRDTKVRLTHNRRAVHEEIDVPARRDTKADRNKKISTHARLMHKNRITYRVPAPQKKDWLSF